MDDSYNEMQSRNFGTLFAAWAEKLRTREKKNTIAF